MIRLFFKYRLFVPSRAHTAISAHNKRRIGRYRERDGSTFFLERDHYYRDDFVHISFFTNNAPAVAGAFVLFLFGGGAVKFRPIGLRLFFSDPDNTVAMMARK